ncbi:EamA family transporter [Dactylosporangium cerinum]
MKHRDVALAVLVSAVWGVNFVVIHVGLDSMSPLLFCALRFAVAALPAVLLVGRPKVPWRWVIATGVALGVVKFSLLFAGMAAGLPSGLSALVLQSQVVFTLVFAVVLLRDRPAGAASRGSPCPGRASCSSPRSSAWTGRSARSCWSSPPERPGAWPTSRCGRRRRPTCSTSWCGSARSRPRP